MLTLALDTTTRVPSSAVLVDGRVTAEWVGDGGRSPAEQLPDGISRALAGAGRGLADIDVLGVAVGPGSFTGLRVGIATMQGLAFALAKPLVGISALDALADAAAERGSVVVAAWVDAWRGEVYAGLYREGRPDRAPVVAQPADLLEKVSGPICFIGDGAETHRELIASTLGHRATFAIPLAPPLAATIARLTERRALVGEAPSPDAIQPLYVRRPDAEIARDARRVG